jgi:DNA recombination protein RmuC
MELYLFVGLAFVLGFAFGYWVKTRSSVSQSRLTELSSEMEVAKYTAREKSEQLLVLQGQLSEKAREFQELRESLVQREAQQQALEARLKENQIHLDKMSSQLSLNFENLANKIFEQKSAQFQKQSETQLDTILKPLQQNLESFRKKVDDSFGVEAKERFALKREIERIAQVNEQMTAQTESLTRALRGDVKAQGNWGEIMLERLLEASGLREGHEFTLQGSAMGLKHPETGRVLKPDVVVHLPDEKHIIIDSKVSLESYRAFIESEEQSEEKARELKKFSDSLRAHVLGLEKRRYQDITGLRSPDFVLMFVPIEGAFALALNQDSNLHNFAWERRIVIVSPTTLYATLRTVSSIWQVERQNQNAQLIAERGAYLYDKFVGFTEDILKIGKHLDHSSSAYHEALGKLREGKGNLVSQVEKLRELGVKNSKILDSSLKLDAEGIETNAPKVVAAKAGGSTLTLPE